MNNGLSERALKVFEERNYGFRILYETILEGAMLDNENKIYSLMCENLRKICKAEISLIVNITSDNQIRVKVHTNEEKTVYTNESAEVFELASSIDFNQYIQNIQVGELIDLGEIKEKKLPEKFLKRYIENCRKIMFSALRVSKEEIEIWLVGFKSASRIRTRDIIQTYISMCGIILEKLRSKLEIQKSNEKFNTLLDNLPVGVMVINKSYEVIEINNSALILLDREKHELIGKPCNNIYYLRGKKDCKNVGLSKEAYESEKCVKRKDGIIINVLQNVIEIELNKELVYLVTIVDITEIKDMEKEKEILLKKLFNTQKQESIITLSAGVAHEINTPLQALHNNISFLGSAFSKTYGLIDEYKKILDNHIVDKDSSVSDRITLLERKSKIKFIRSESQNAIRESKASIDRVSEVVGYMKDFTKGDNERKVIISINNLIHDFIDIYCFAWKNEFEMTVEYEANMPSVSCYISKFKEALMAIFDNASEATTSNSNIDKKKIRFTTYHTDEHIGVSIEDSGSGIPKESREKIFEPFYTTKDVGKGTGQGLTLAYNIIVEQHNGNLYFDSVEGKGTTFYIELPINDVEVDDD